jgi:hypothetical protein
MRDRRKEMPRHIEWLFQQARARCKVCGDLIAEEVIIDSPWAWENFKKAHEHPEVT